MTEGTTTSHAMLYVGAKYRQELAAEIVRLREAGVHKQAGELSQTLLELDRVLMKVREAA